MTIDDVHWKLLIILQTEANQQWAYLIFRYMIILSEHFS